MTTSTTNECREEQLRKAIARICYSNGDTAGTGFLISNQYVLTCAHVIQEVLKEKTSDSASNKAEIKLYLPFVAEQRNSLITEVVFPENISLNLVDKPLYDQDIAILKLKVDLPENTLFIQLDRTGYEDECPVLSQGFPQNHIEAMPVEGIARGSVTYGLHQIQTNNNEPYQITDGYSGSPVWTKDPLKRIIGMVVAKEYNSRILAAFFIPSSILLERIPPKYIPQSTDDSKNKKNFPRSIAKHDKKHLSAIAESLINGNIIPFFGPGLDPLFYLELEKKLTDLVGKEVYEESWKALEGDELQKRQERQKRMKLISKIIGLPCSSCHYFIEHRGDESKQNCPMLGGVLTTGAVTSNDPLYPIFAEQQLSVAMMNIRHLSQYYEFAKNIADLYTNIEEILNEIECLDSFKVYEFFHNLPSKMQRVKKPAGYSGQPYDLILTTNYVFQQDYLQQPNKIFTEVVKGRQSDTVKFFYQDSEGRREIDNDFEPAKLSHNNFLVTGGENLSSPKRQPLILQLYGISDTFCVISNDHFNSLLKKLTELPSNVITAIQNRPLLFLGFSKNDYELQQIVKCLSIDKSVELEGWIVYQDVPSNENEDEELGKLSEKIWDRIAGHIQLLPIRTSSKEQISLKDFIDDLSHEIDAKLNI